MSILSPHVHPHEHRSPTGAAAYTRRLRLALVLNTSFFVIELLGGLHTHSTAILSDALHDFGDTLALGFALYAQRLALRPADGRYSYGYGRFSLLGALVTTLVLVLGSFIILREAVPHLWSPPPVKTEGVFALAVLGVVVNGLAALQLRKGQSLNERVAALHLFEDVLGWMAVLVGAALMWAFGWRWIDPLLAVLIAGYILASALRNLWKTLRVLLQAVPEQIDGELIRRALTALPQVAAVCDLHLWSLDGEYVVATVHLVLRHDLSLSEAAACRAHLRNRLQELGVDHCTIELEFGAVAEAAPSQC
jgi:cobalt-zinc-cadmium efflux system protein